MESKRAGSEKIDSRVEGSLPSPAPKPAPLRYLLSAIKAWLLGVRSFFLYLIDTLNILLHPVRPSNDVLLLRCDGIGDFVLWLSAAEALVHHYRAQGSRVTLLAHPLWASWARSLALFDDVLVLELERCSVDIPYRWRMVAALRARGFECAVEPTPTRRLLVDLIVRASGAGQRICIRGDAYDMGSAWQRRLRDGWYTWVVDTGEEPLMELVHNAEFVRRVAEPAYLAQVADIRKLSAPASQPLSGSGIPESTPYYVLFPGASASCKLWPCQSFARVAEWLYAQTGWHGVVCGSPADRSLADGLCSASQAPLLNLAGKTDLGGLVDVLAGARLLLANDTGATHIAAALGVPTLCLLGGGHPDRFLPYRVEALDGRPLPLVVSHPLPCFGCRWVCIYPLNKTEPAPCIGLISVEDAIAAVGALLRTPAPARTH